MLRAGDRGKCVVRLVCRHGCWPFIEGEYVGCLVNSLIPRTFRSSTFLQLLFRSLGLMISECAFLSRRRKDDSATFVVGAARRYVRNFTPLQVSCDSHQAFRTRLGRLSIAGPARCFRPNVRLRSNADLIGASTFTFGREFFLPVNRRRCFRGVPASPFATASRC